MDNNASARCCRENGCSAHPQRGAARGLMLGSGMLTLLMLSLGCDAGFIDERLERPRLDGSPPTDTSGVDASLGEPFARGSFEGRSIYDGTGQAELLRNDQGSVVLRFSPDFRVAVVPGPIVVLSSRAEIGSDIDPATDTELGVLEDEVGEQTYAVPDGDADKRYAWVYCKPIGVEVARAQMEDLP